MKNLKKILALVLTVVFVLCAFAGCGAKEDPKTDESVTGEIQVQKLVMATNASFPPYEYYEGGKIVGIDAEIAAKIAEKLGRELEIVDTEFGSIVGGVQTGKFDIGMAGMTVTEERMQSVNFSETYAIGVQSIIVKADSAYKTLDDLLDDTAAKIGVQQDTTGDIYSTEDFGEDRVVRYKTGNDAVQALVSGKVSAVIIDNEPAKSYIAANEGLAIQDSPYTEENYAIAIAKENTELLNDINTALAELKADGTIQGIVDKYIPAE
ncbi:MAG: ABC transporter substrate-binding protein [Oscillospiraceae bacterium]|nr:ABC transporter substrate-binding protein [Oscillospiraceae bacterium]